MHLYLKVVTARVHVVFKYSFTSPYRDGTAILRGHSSHVSARGGINPRKPHIHSARVLTIFGIEIGTGSWLHNAAYHRD